MATKAGALTAPTPAVEQQEREQIFDIFRRWGYLQASLDPLGQFLPPEPFPTPAPEGEAAAVHGRGLDLIDDSAVLWIHFKNFVGIDLVENPEVAVGGELEILGQRRRWKLDVAPQQDRDRAPD